MFAFHGPLTSFARNSGQLYLYNSYQKHVWIVYHEGNFFYKWGFLGFCLHDQRSKQLGPKNQEHQPDEGKKKMKKKEKNLNRSRWIMLIGSAIVLIAVGSVLLTRLKSDKKGRVKLQITQSCEAVDCSMATNCGNQCCQDEPSCWIQVVRVAFPNGGTINVKPGAGKPFKVFVPAGQYRTIGLVASDMGADFWCSNAEILVQMVKGTMSVWVPGVSHPNKFVGKPDLKKMDSFHVVHSNVHVNWRVQ